MGYAELIKIRTPELEAKRKEYDKFRSVYNGGLQFKEKYLKKHKTESINDYARRLDISYSPAIARSAILTITHAISRKLPQVRRSGIPPSVLDWIEYVGYDELRQTILIPNLLVVGGCYMQVEPDRLIDLPREYMRAKSPNYDAFLYELNIPQMESQLIAEEKREYWYYAYDNKKPFVSRITEKGELIERTDFDTELLPIAYAELPYPLMRDIADYQISALNLASVDVDYLNRSGFPIYTEQRNYDESIIGGSAFEHSGSQTDAQTARNTSPGIEAGNSAARAYYAGLERPGFISPEPSNTVVSMQKQLNIESEMMRVLDLASAYMRGEVQSGVSQAIERSEQIGAENMVMFALQDLERQIFRFVAEYYGEVGDNIIVEYPLSNREQVEVTVSDNL